MPVPALLLLCSSSVAPFVTMCSASHRYSFIERGLSGVIFGGCERLWPSNRKPRPLDGCPTFAPSVRGPKTTGDPDFLPRGATNVRVCGFH